MATAMATDQTNLVVGGGKSRERLAEDHGLLKETLAAPKGARLEYEEIAAQPVSR